MEKTSREYAEKMAEELYPNSGLVIKHVCIESYMKAVEETNVKGLLVALEKSYDFMKVIYNNLPIQMHNMNIKNYKKLFDDYLAIQTNNENAINKATK